MKAVPAPTTPWAPATGKVIKDWVLHTELGRGTFGTVYSAQNIHTEKMGAIKLENRSVDQESRRLKVEVAVINDLIKRKARRCVTYLDYGRIGQYNYIVMPLLGLNLQRLATMVRENRLNRNGLLSVATVLHIGTTSLDAIKELHRCHYIHRDIKPENFALGKVNPMHELYLIDFGTARMYAHTTGEHYRPRAVAAFRGTYMYASPNALRENEQSRRDDIWSWLFMLIEFFKGFLPWGSITIPRDCTLKEALDLYAAEKEMVIKNPKLLLLFCPNCFHEILSHINTYIHFRQPEYDLFQDLLHIEMKRTRLQGKSLTLDWLKRAYHAKH